MIRRPMLAARARELSDVWFPCACTPKLDGVRAVTLGGQLLSRAFKPIRNEHLQQLAATLPQGLDGELMSGDNFQDTTSAVMSYDGTPNVEYWCFDWFGDGLTLPYYERVQRLAALQLPPLVRVLTPTMVQSADEFLALEAEALAAGHEGLIARSAVGPYKEGRSSLRERYMLKWKRFTDSEAVILALVEGQTNLNPQVPNAFGLMKRPGGRSGKVAKGTLGAFVVQDIHTGVQFELGTGIGLTTALRQELWDARPSCVGSIVRYRYQATGVKDRPRFPSFMGFRHADDVTTDAGEDA